MASLQKYDVLIIGGGLAGLCCALHLSFHNVKILLIEKDTYPHHKVCGEYVSNEVLSYLNSLGINPMSLGAKCITDFEISNKKGSLLKAKLPLGGFGLSRYAFDNILYKAIKEKVDVIFDTVESVAFENNHFSVSTLSKQQYSANFVVGAFGKRSNVDIFMKRSFIQKPSSWLAVKAHYTFDFSDTTVALHNFNGGYCGLSKTETNAVNACYLTTHKSFKRFGNISEFQKKVLSENPYLKHFFKEAQPLFKKPLTISQISFEQKQAVEDHIFMLGDSAGLIHPLCGNGMAMAIHSAKLFSEVFLKAFSKEEVNRNQMELEYTRVWKETFSKRIQIGRSIQKVLLHPAATTVGFSIAKQFPSIISSLIRKTHGNSLK